MDQGGLFYLAGTALSVRRASPTWHCRAIRWCLSHRPLRSLNALAYGALRAGLLTVAQVSSALNLRLRPLLYLCCSCVRRGSYALYFLTRRALYSLVRFPARSLIHALPSFAAHIRARITWRG